VDMGRPQVGPLRRDPRRDNVVIPKHPVQSESTGVARRDGRRDADDGVIQCGACAVGLPRNEVDPGSSARRRWRRRTVRGDPRDDLEFEPEASRRTAGNFDCTYRLQVRDACHRRT